MLRLRCGKRHHQREEEEDRQRINERRRQMALQQWERRLRSVERDCQGHARISSRWGHPRATQELRYVDVNAAAKGEEAASSHALDPAYKGVNLDAKRLQRLEQAQAMYRLLDSMGGREA